MGENYVGRFAPSPTGPLHLGSLYIAVASYLDAKHHNGAWLLRIEDVDLDRKVDGADLVIIESLKKHGLISDQPIQYQSQNLDLYEQALNRLFSLEQCFYCCCSRRTLKTFRGYPGLCRQQKQPTQGAAIKLLVDNNEKTRFNDRYLLEQIRPTLPKNQYNDFILKKKRGFFSYYLACTLDDANQKVTHVIRGMDILDCTFNQAYLQSKLNLNQPKYCHLPLLIDKNNIKLSKQNFAQPINNSEAKNNLLYVLKLLNQPIPSKAQTNTIDSILKFAIDNWSLAHITKWQKTIAIDE